MQFVQAKKLEIRFGCTQCKSIGLYVSDRQRRQRNVQHSGPKNTTASDQCPGKRRTDLFTIHTIIIHYNTYKK